MDDLAKDLPFIKTADTKIPIPDPSYLRKKLPAKKSEDKKLSKHAREFDAYCKWSALPVRHRSPKRVYEFEKKWKLPKGYTEYFRSRDDYQDKRLTYFWDWMMDKFPEVVDNLYIQSAKNTNAAKILVDLVAKKINIEKPRTQVMPMLMVGVDQKKIDKMFIPQGYENVEDIVPAKEVK